MTITIPSFVLWVLAGLAGVIVLVLAAFGALMLVGMSRSKIWP